MLRRLTQLTFLLILTASASRAQSPAAPTTADDRPFLTRINGLFNGDLPQLDPPGTMKLILRPHFGDLIHRDYMRVETGLRWALNDSFELSAEASTFFTHGLKGSAGYGIGKLRFGSKYVFEEWPDRNYETTVGLNIELPVGHAPIDMSDGYNHFAPNIVVQHLSTRIAHLTTFAGTGLDLMNQSSTPGTFATNQPHDDSISVTAGGIYDVGQLKWTLAGTYATTALIGNRTENFYYLQPGVLWYVPGRFTFHSKTQWIVGLSARTTWGPDGFDLSLGSRVRAEITFRQVLTRFRERQSK